MRRAASWIVQAAIAALAVSAPAMADCNAQISKAGPISPVAYDPFDGVARSVTFDVEFTNRGNDACTISLAVAGQTPGASRYFKNGADQLRYTVEWSDGSALPNNISSPQGSISLQGGNGKKKTATLRVKVPAGLIGPAKTYTDMLTLRAYKAGTSTRLGSDLTASDSAVVAARAQVNIAGSVSSKFGAFGIDEIDFHTMTTGEIKNAIVQVRATTAVAIGVTSQNKGKLRHKILLADPGVVYTMSLDGVSVNLTSPVTLNRAPPVSLDGSSYPMILTLGSVAGRPAGNYQDCLTITVSPQ